MQKNSSEVTHGIGHLGIQFTASNLVDRFSQQLAYLTTIAQRFMRRVCREDTRFLAARNSAGFTSFAPRLGCLRRMEKAKPVIRASMSQATRAVRFPMFTLIFHSRSQ